MAQRSTSRAWTRPKKAKQDMEINKTLSARFLFFSVMSAFPLSSPQEKNNAWSKLAYIK